MKEGAIGLCAPGRGSPAGPPPPVAAPPTSWLRAPSRGDPPLKSLAVGGGPPPCGDLAYAGALVWADTGERVREKVIRKGDPQVLIVTLFWMRRTGSPPLPASNV